MLKVILTGKTKKGKMVVKRDGSEWSIERGEQSVQFTMRSGPWLLLANEKGRRWVHGHVDRDFELERAE